MLIPIYVLSVHFRGRFFFVKEDVNFLVRFFSLYLIYVYIYIYSSYKHKIPIFVPNFRKIKIIVIAA